LLTKNWHVWLREIRRAPAPCPLAWLRQIDFDWRMTTSCSRRTRRPLLMYLRFVCEAANAGSGPSRNPPRCCCQLLVAPRSTENAILGHKTAQGICRTRSARQSHCRQGAHSTLQHNPSSITTPCNFSPTATPTAGMLFWLPSLCCLTVHTVEQLSCYRAADQAGHSTNCTHQGSKRPHSYEPSPCKPLKAFTQTQKAFNQTPKTYTAHHQQPYKTHSSSCKQLHSCRWQTQKPKHVKDLANTNF
jgi:hypothetical protein